MLRRITQDANLFPTKLNPGQYAMEGKLPEQRAGAVRHCDPENVRVIHENYFVHIILESRAQGRTMLMRVLRSQHPASVGLRQHGR